MVSPQQIPLYFEPGLAIEGVKAIIPKEADVGNGILKIPAYTTAEDLMRFDLPSTNVNEYYMGIMGEFPLDNLDLTQKSLYKLMANKF